MYSYPLYFKEFGLRRPNSIRVTREYSKFKDIPKNSVIHDGSFLQQEISKEASILPPDDILLKFRENRKLLALFDWKLQSDYVVPVDTSGIRLFSAGVEQQLRKFRSRDIKLIKDIDQFTNSITYLNSMFYDPIMRAHVTGHLKKQKIFSVFLAKLLTNVAKRKDLNHFVFIPTEELTLRKLHFQKSFKKYERISYAFPESPYYLFVMHIMGYLQIQDTDSYFDHVSIDILEKLNIVFYNEQSDKCIHIRLDKLKMYSEKIRTLDRQLLTTLNSVARVPDQGEQIEQIDESVIKITASVGDTEQLNIAEFKQPLKPEERAESSKLDVKQRVESVAMKLSADKELSVDQKKAAMKNALAYKKIQLDGVPLEEIMYGDSNNELKPNDLEGIVDVPDKSMLKSGASSFHKQYVQKEMKKDMVNNLLDLSNQGVFLIDLKKEVIDDGVNHIEKYSAVFKDKKGKQSTIKFHFPVVDEHGEILLNGAKKKLTLQRVNNPICKVSPTRVTINSSANKTLVEMNNSFSNSLVKQIKRILNKTQVDIHASAGVAVPSDIVLPRSYGDIATHYGSFTCKSAGLDFCFDYDVRLHHIKDEKAKNQILKIEKDYGGVYLGVWDKMHCFMDVQGTVHREDGSSMQFIDVLDTFIHDVKIGPYNEWVNMVLLNKKFPVMFVLSYRFGFEAMLKHLKIEYTKIPKGSRVAALPSDVLIKTYDVTYLIKQPLPYQRFLVCGMNKYNLSEIEHSTLETKDAYFELLQQQGLSHNFLKGIDFLFDLFLDPITRDVLREMREPTNMKDLLIRATCLLSTTDHKEAASSAHFRYRSYEIFNAVLYKTLSRALSTYTNKAVGHSNKFTVSEYEVLKNISTHSLLNNVNVVNPITEVKENLHYTHIGDGGRTGESMMIPDRRYPKDGIGIISESTVDSGKVGIDGILSVDSNIVNTRGMTISKPVKELEPTEVLSPTALLYPGSTMDD